MCKNLFQQNRIAREEKKEQKREFEVVCEEERTKWSIGEEAMLMFAKGRLVNSDCDLAIMRLPDCLRVTRLDWVIPENSGSQQNYLWILYETTKKVSSISVIKAETRESTVKCSKHYSIEFDKLILDANCIGSMNTKENVMAMISLVTHSKEDASIISFYNLPLNTAHSNSCIKLREPIKSFELHKKIYKLAWNCYNPTQMAVSDSEYNLYLLNTEQGETILRYHRAHAMQITEILWIFNDRQKAFALATSSHDGNVKFWDLEDPFAPSLVHSIGQRWIYGIEWDPLLNVLHYNSEGKGNSYSYLVFYEMQSPILKKYVVPSQATLVLLVG
eukprot:TRINITY_DN1985_c0_g6_i1.p1 TRINITY_DN1985_c0_g6~~TRINITY_DN1985_c0_g6_i1.p1  ORF type:complete len:331 (-),score=49.95 TRINITY_DN1985_c0_g6_i1:375-1367(-)